MVIDLSGIEKVVNKIYYPLLTNTSRYLVLYGGAGSGKSKFAGQKVLVQCLLAKHKILVVRKVANTLRNSCFSLLCGYIAEWGLQGYFKINKSDMQILCLFNGSSILFKGMDDSEKIKSIDGITSIWIEEASELSLEDFTQLDLRLRGITKVHKQIILTFNPVSAEHWLKKRFFENVEELNV
ncbi:PBSX family phage terminase large subunit [Helicobacter sp.]|uniref:PBSX family phage terminase large subunit n=1 Tax=Helicobacter sp. TaxID=218 RepID=UPI002A75A6E1|nr:PBSX family phage terminase large subunit [Helicobacter sp.]MDY2585008.1 PBSX family phage terminase large subunit [Helicobacter sp.]